MSENIELSVVVLCYGAEKSIIPFSQNLKKEISKHVDDFEILLIGNYVESSSDTTPEIIKKIAQQDSTFKSISKPKKGMMGWDVKVGLSAAKGEFICFIDGDGQFPINSISECYKKIKTGEFGLVKTYRFKRKDGLQRAAMSFVYNIVFKILFPKVKARDINSKPKIFRRDVYEKLNLTYDDWFIDAEIMIKTSSLGVKFHEFPIEFEQLAGRTSFVNLNTVLEFIRNLISYKINHK
jgi:glycosyltransferase involved in cell wall biosynthesis